MPDPRVVWFRRDLRTFDHPALTDAVAGGGPVVPLFVLDPRILHGRYASGPRTRFLLGCLAELDERLRALGSTGLVVRHGDPAAEVPRVAREARAASVSWTSDVSPYARRRDAAVTEALRTDGVEARPHPGNYVGPFATLAKPDGEPFRVFSPFLRAWLAADRREVLPEPAALARHDLPTGALPTAEELGLPDDVPEPRRAPGERAARRAAEEFVRLHVARYAGQAKIGDESGSSAMSPYLRFGCVSPRWLETQLHAEASDRWPKVGPGAYRRQLAWGDFYAMVLLRHPDNLRFEQREELRRTIEWDDAPERLEAWKAGRTGFPIVDAGMRELAATGWMHNRARLIVGSFLVKDLHLDWRDGERHFASLLLDGEPAQNNGNWQWIAGTGTDPQPVYKRTYNPTLQGQRHDPEGEYVRRWVPELRHVPGAAVHEPWKLGLEAGPYPPPIVDHQKERKEALRRFGEALSGDVPN